MAERGSVRSRQYAEQGRDFRRLRFGTITPTDIDACIEYKDKAFVFIEAKHEGASLPVGQELAIERLCDACDRAGKPSIGIIADHRHPAHEQIDVGAARVRALRWRRRWHGRTNPETVEAIVRKFVHYVERRQWWK